MGVSIVLIDSEDNEKWIAAPCPVGPPSYYLQKIPEAITPQNLAARQPLILKPKIIEFDLIDSIGNTFFYRAKGPFRFTQEDLA